MPEPETDAKRLSTLYLFLGLSLVASWATWLFLPESGGPFSLMLFGWRISLPLRVVKLLIGNCIPGALAFVMSAIEGEGRFAVLAASLARWRVPFRWYLFAFAFPFGIFATAFFTVFFFFPAVHSLPSAKNLTVDLLLTLPFGPLWEEIAWRDYCLPRMQSFFPPVKSALLLGVYWSVWHIPLWVTTLNLDKTTAAPVLTAAVLSTIALSVIQTYLYNGSGCALPVTILSHGIYSSFYVRFFAALRVGRIHFILLSSLLFVLLAMLLTRSMKSAQRPCEQ